MPRYTRPAPLAVGGLSGSPLETLLLALVAVGVVVLVGRSVLRVAWKLVVLATLVVAELWVASRSPTGCSDGRYSAAASRKFSTRSWPAPVSTDSGWNCTHSMGCSRCRTPIASAPSVVSAVTSKQAGIEVQASEW